MTAIEIYEEVEYLERVVEDGPINYKNVVIIAMERYKNGEMAEMEQRRYCSGI